MKNYYPLIGAIAVTILFFFSFGFENEYIYIWFALLFILVSYGIGIIFGIEITKHENYECQTQLRESQKRIEDLEGRIMCLNEKLSKEEEKNHKNT